MQNQPSGFGNPWLQLTLSVLCVLVSELLLKRGATDIADLSSAWSWTGVNGLVSPLVRSCPRRRRAGLGCQTSLTDRGTPVTFLSFFFILASLLSFVWAQVVLKRAMEATRKSGFRNLRFISRVVGGIALMTISFFLTLGLLQRFDLSYLYPFQGLSVIIISLMAAVMLKEKLTLQLTIGALLISTGIVLVSLS